MILQTKAIEPKSGSATGTYPAIILLVSSPGSNKSFVNLQVYCPAIMSGTLEEAKYATNNWISAPLYLYKDEEDKTKDIKYDFKVGGLIVISYQDGNINTPQFVREIPIDKTVRERNAMYVRGADITADTLFDILDLSLDLTSPGLQKGVTLLPALKACNKINLRHFYGYTQENEKLTTIYRCGTYGTELIYQSDEKDVYRALVNIRAANFDFLDNRNDKQYQWLSICQRLLEVEDRSVDDKCLVDIVNSTLIANESKEDNKVAKFDKTNDADVLYWYTKLAGYIYANHGKTNKNKLLDEEIDKEYDKSNIISSELSKSVAGRNLKFKQLQSTFYTWFALNSFEIDSTDLSTPTISLYKGTFRKDGSTEDMREATFSFIDKLFTQLCKNEFFNNQLAICYSIILSNNLLSFRQTYGADSLYNKALLICVVIASAFPTLQKTLQNLSINAEENQPSNDEIIIFSNTLQNMKQLRKCIKDSSLPLPSTADIATDLTQMYFRILGLSVEVIDNVPHTPKDVFEYNNNPVEVIWDCMCLGINYILDNYDYIKQKLDTPKTTFITGDGIYTDGSPSQYGFVWPTPGYSRITSPFGPRRSSYHYGIDIGLPTGSEVVAIADGTVTRVGWQNPNNSKEGYGKRIYINHGNGVESRYAHLNDFMVKNGDQVKQGQVIAHSDNTGHSTGPHLHFEIRFNGAAKNPVDYVSSNNTAGQKTQIESAATQPNGPSTAKSGNYYNIPLSHDVQDHLFYECSKYGVSVALMVALIECESSFRPNADSGSSVGLCQINRNNWSNLSKVLGITDFFDPKQNITCGVYMLGGLLQSYGTSTEGCHHALTAYNRGENGAKKFYKKHGTYHSSYSNKVMAAYEKYL